MEQPFTHAEAYEFSPEDVHQNKAMAILAYFIFFLPLLAAKDSRFARYHANQGLIVLIAYVALYLVQVILSAILFAGLAAGSLALGGFAIVSLLFTLIYLGLLVLLILGIINAAQGKAKPVPLIGGFTLIK